MELVALQLRDGLPHESHESGAATAPTADAARDVIRQTPLAAVMDALPEAVLLHDREGRLIQTNSAARSLFGLDAVPDFALLPSAERLAMMRMRDASGRTLAPDAWHIPRILRGEVITSDDPFEVRAQSLDGRELLVSFTGAPIRDEAGTIIGAISLGRDVTGRRTLEREALARAAELEATYDAMTDAVVILDTHGNVLRANTAAIALYERIGVPDYGELPMTSRTTLFALMDGAGNELPRDQWPASRILRGETLQDASAMDVQFAVRGGGVIRMNATGSPVRDATGNVSGAVIVYRDVTDARRMERRTHQALDALLAMAQTLVQPATPSDAPSLDDLDAPAPVSPVAQRLAELTCDVLGCRRVGITVVEPETRLMRAVAVVGLTPEQEKLWWIEQQTQQMRYGEGADPEMLARFAAGEPLVIDMREPPFNAQPNPYGITTSLFAPMILQGTVVGILSLDYGGEPHGFDTSERALASTVAQLAALVIERERLLRERAVAEAQTLALREANRRMDEFLSVASHELRTPVTVIKANLQILAKRHTLREPSEEARMDAMLRERAVKAVERLTRLVDDLLDISRIRVGRLEFHEELVDLAAIVRDVVEEQSLANPDRAIVLEAETDASLPVLADADRIGQVVLNYLTNALKYSLADKPVTVRLSHEGLQARVSVRDEGPGIPLNEQADVWEIFHRAAGITVQSGSGVGLGLGLHLCKTIIERHGGTVGLESERGHGSTFWFTLPLAVDRAE